MFSILDFIVLICAASGALHVWFRGSIFDGARAYLEARQDAVLSGPPPAEVVEDDDLPPSDPLPLWMRLADRLLPDWACELLLCPFCFSHHSPWIVAVVSLVPANALLAVAEILPEDGWVPTLQILATLIKVPAYSLAATRVANVLHAFLPDEARYRDRPTDDPGVPGDVRPGDAG